MEKSLLINMINLAASNQLSKSLKLLANTIANDEYLGDIVYMNQFSNELYSVRELKFIDQCFNFRII